MIKCQILTSLTIYLCFRGWSLEWNNFAEYRMMSPLSWLLLKTKSFSLYFLPLADNNMGCLWGRPRRNPAGFVFHGSHKLQNGPVRFQRVPLFTSSLGKIHAWHTKRSYIFNKPFLGFCRYNSVTFLQVSVNCEHHSVRVCHKQTVLRNFPLLEYHLVWYGDLHGHELSSVRTFFSQP